MKLDNKYIFAALAGVAVYWLFIRKPGAANTGGAALTGAELSGQAVTSPGDNLPGDLWFL